MLCKLEDYFILRNQVFYRGHNDFKVMPETIRLYVVVIQARFFPYHLSEPSLDVGIESRISLPDEGESGRSSPI
uniref:Maturase K n=1 Tax=Denticeps clupeoides TaxID=299321 RepID=A0AAY4AS74_9TELE